MELKDIVDRVRLIIDVIEAEPLEGSRKKYDDDTVYGIALQKETAARLMLNRLYEELVEEMNF